MQRRKFIQTSIWATPLAGMAASCAESEAGEPPYDNNFVVKSGKDHFNEPIKYRGISPNLVKISARDTSGQFSVFEYEGLSK